MEKSNPVATLTVDAPADANCSLLIRVDSLDGGNITLKPVESCQETAAILAVPECEASPAQVRKGPTVQVECIPVNGIPLCLPVKKAVVEPEQVPECVSSPAQVHKGPTVQVESIPVEGVPLCLPVKKAVAEPEQVPECVSSPAQVHKGPTVQVESIPVEGVPLCLPVKKAVAEPEQVLETSEFVSASPLRSSETQPTVTIEAINVSPPSAESGAISYTPLCVTLL